MPRLYFLSIILRKYEEAFFNKIDSGGGTGGGEPSGAAPGGIHKAPFPDSSSLQDHAQLFDDVGSNSSLTRKGTSGFKCTHVAGNK